MNLSEMYRAAKIKPQWVSTGTFLSNTINNNRAKYEKVSNKTGFDWRVVAAIHWLESSGSFFTHLHNGDPLTARTRQVPAGRPAKGNPPFTWVESAIDALSTYKPPSGLEDTLDFLERYNGTGYRSRGVNSPYLWSGTNWYLKGKYIADGRYDPNAVSAQLGAVAILKALNFGEDEMSDVTWFEFHRNEKEDPSIVGWAGSVPRVKINTNKVDDLLAFFEEHKSAKTFAVARSDKHLPEIKEAEKAVETGKVNRSKIVQVARARCSQGRAHAPGNIIDVEVLDPIRPAMKRLGQMGLSDNDSFYNWCAANVTRILRDCGLNVPDQPLINGKPFWATVALVEAWKAWAISKGAWRNSRLAEPGDIIIYDWDGNGVTDHIGIILENRSDGVLAAEGNKNNREAIIFRGPGTFAGTIDVEKLLGS